MKLCYNKDNLDNFDLSPSKNIFFLMCSFSWAKTTHRSHSCQSDEVACHQHYNTQLACLHQHVTERRKETMKALKKLKLDTVTS